MGDVRSGLDDGLGHCLHRQPCLDKTMSMQERVVIDEDYECRLNYAGV